MNACPIHQDCTWYRHNPDNVGRDLGYGAGWANARDFVAADHPPMEGHLLPVSNGRGDYFALGFLNGLTASWCPDHDASQCLSTWRCVKRVREITPTHALERAS